MTGPTRPRTTFKIAWNQDGARQLEVVVDADLPQYGPLEKRVRGIASIATSHGGLRRLLQDALAEQWLVSVWDTVGGITTVRLTPIEARERGGPE